MNRGRLEQVGTPAEIYQRPQTRFAAEFIDDVNLLHERRPSADGLIAVRPKIVRFCEPADGLLFGRIRNSSFLGDQVLHRVEVDGCERPVLARQRAQGAVALDSQVDL